MGKNKKSAAPSAAQQAAAQQIAPEVGNNIPAVVTEPVQILNKEQRSGLSQDSKVTYANLLQRRYVDNPNKEKYGEAFLVGVDTMIDALVLDIAVGELACNSSATGLIIRAKEENYAKFASMAAKMGVMLPAYKSLPKPTIEQLQSAGLSNLLPNQAALVVINDKTVSDEAKKKKKAERAVEQKVHLDPTQVENEEQLKQQLTQCFLGSETPTERIRKAINFYNSYLTVQANKAENKEEALKKVKETSRMDMLREITNIVGECTFAMTGFAHYLNDLTNKTGSPVSAFCAYKRASAKTEKDLSDSFVADIVKILVNWSNTTAIAQQNKMIAACRRNIKKLEENKDKNGNAIAAEQTAIRAHESEIIGMQAIVECVNNPKFDIATNLEADYTSEETSQKYKIAHQVVDNIVDTYYKGTKPSDYTQESLLKMANMRIGSIINLFTDPLSQSIAYKEGTVPELVKAEVATEEETKEEKKESKN